jgi:hypothetical protein
LTTQATRPTMPAFLISLLLLALPLQGAQIAVARVAGPAHVHVGAALTDHEHLAEHDHDGIGHHHHEVDEAGVVYVADPESDSNADAPKNPQAKRVVLDHEASAHGIAPAQPLALPAPHGGGLRVVFASHIAEPPERPPR